MKKFLGLLCFLVTSGSMQAIRVTVQNPCDTDYAISILEDASGDIVNMTTITAGQTADIQLAEGAYTVLQESQVLGSIPQNDNFTINCESASAGASAGFFASTEPVSAGAGAGEVSAGREQMAQGLVKSILDLAQMVPKHADLHIREIQFYVDNAGDQQKVRDEAERDQKQWIKFGEEDYQEIVKPMQQVAQDVSELTHEKAPKDYAKRLNKLSGTFDKLYRKNDKVEARRRKQQEDFSKESIAFAEAHIKELMKFSIEHAELFANMDDLIATIINTFSTMIAQAEAESAESAEAEAKGEAAAEATPAEGELEGGELATLYGSDEAGAGAE